MQAQSVPLWRTQTKTLVQFCHHTGRPALRQTNFIYFVHENKLLEWTEVRHKEERQAGQVQGRRCLHWSKLILNEGLQATQIYKIYPFPKVWVRCTS